MDEVLRSSSLLLAGCFQSLNYNYILPNSYLVRGSLIGHMAAFFAVHDSMYS